MTYAVRGPRYPPHVGGQKMSMAAIHESKQLKQFCQRCRERKARFQYRGVVRADRDHTLCFECFRSERDRQRASRLASVATKPLRSPFVGDLRLSPAEVTHRRAMLAHLQIGRPQ